ncbi:hypothetical protein [Dysgonomonas sp. 25]|uniref:hypothetical protein n=1 Tax=Dysgonomonas sp. 25 TaxID=2302933 RepID=UPI0013D72402|nr:hypothetical protein [Dysgonomonas sp. 25]
MKQSEPDADNVTADKGFLLPRVNLLAQDELDPIFPGATDQQKKGYVGMVVYHVGNEDLCSGLYIWDGSEWERYPGPCGLKSSTILSFGFSVNTYGYSAESSASRALLFSPNNFGQLPTSITRSNPFIPLGHLVIDGMTTANFTNTSYFRANPDILIAGHHVHTTSTDVVNALVNYLNSGGVLILFDEYGVEANSLTIRLLKALFPADASQISRSGLSGPGAVYTISSAIDDEITNGPFGDLRGKYWGEDSSTTFGIKGIPAGKAVVYSQGNVVGSSTNSDYASIFRLKDVNLFFVGDGGFLSNPSTTIGPTPSGATACPFAIDEDSHPIPRTNYGAGYVVQNSQLFANIMYWAGKNAKSNK